MSAYGFGVSDTRRVHTGLALDLGRHWSRSLAPRVEGRGESGSRKPKNDCAGDEQADCAQRCRSERVSRSLARDPAGDRQQKRGQVANGMLPGHFPSLRPPSGRSARRGLGPLPIALQPPPSGWDRLRESPDRGSTARLGTRSRQRARHLRQPPFQPPRGDQLDPAPTGKGRADNESPPVRSERRFG